MWIVEQVRYPTDQPTDTASYIGALSHLQSVKTRISVLARGYFSPIIAVGEEGWWDLNEPYDSSWSPGVVEAERVRARFQANYFKALLDRPRGIPGYFMALFTVP